MRRNFPLLTDTARPVPLRSRPNTQMTPFPGPKPPLRARIDDLVLMHHAQLDNRLISAIGLRRDPIRSAPAGGFAKPVR